MTSGKHKTCGILSAFLGTVLLVAAILAYSQYLTLKKVLISRISDRATALMGQKVEIGDISLSAGAGIAIRDLTVRNPEGSVRGDLLRISRVHLDMRYRELFSGRFSFRSIELDSPELSLLRDEKGGLNISKTLIGFLSKKGTSAYQIDALLIRDAAFGLNEDPHYRIRDINVTLDNLSSAPDAKTTVRAGLTFPDNNKATAEGWFFLQDAHRRFSLSLISEGINFNIWKETLKPYSIDMGKSRADIRLHAEGDTDKGIRLNGDVSLKSSGFFLFRNKDRDISLHADALFAPSEGTVVLNGLSLRTGNDSAVHIKGRLTDLYRAPAYNADIKIEKLDLASFRVIKGIEMGGIVASENLSVKGSLSALPQASGTITLSQGLLNMGPAEVRKLQATMRFAADRETTFQAEGSAEILRLDTYRFGQPVTAALSADGKGRPALINLASHLVLSSASLDLNGKIAGFSTVDAIFKGRLQGEKIAGSAALSAKGLHYDSRRLRDLDIKFLFDHDRNRTSLNSLRIDSGLLTAAADSLTMALQQDSRKKIELRNLNLLYPEMKAELKGLGCTVSAAGSTENISGTAVFNLDRLLLGGMAGSSISGKGSFDSSSFTLDMSLPDLFRGAVSLELKGKTKGGPFPLSMNATAAHLDLSQASAAVRSFAKMPYSASGELDSLTLSGTLHSTESVTGRASVEAKKFSVADTGSRTMLKDALLRSEVVFRDKDLDLKADFSVGSIKASLAGTVERAYEPDRSLRLGLTVPEVRLNDIRTAFWDVVPDRLLYAGLEGSVALIVNAIQAGHAITADGSVLLRDISIEGENGEYSAGPINGMVPFHYSTSGDKSASAVMRGFESADFGETRKRFREAKSFYGNEVRIGSVRYGFRLFEDVSLWLEQKGSGLNISRLSAKMFGGRLYGTAYVDLTAGLGYRAGLLVDGVSLAQLCEDIPPIKGYISGKVDGIAGLKGSGAGLEGLIGKADFWTYSDDIESTRISREFLEKIGGPQVRAYLGERRFNRGIMGLYIQNGFLIFRELEISNRNLLGITDLSVKVAPLNNRIAIDHLLWTMTEAAARAKK